MKGGCQSKASCDWRKTKLMRLTESKKTILILEKFCEGLYELSINLTDGIAFEKQKLLCVLIDELQQALDHGGRLGGKFRLALHLQLAAAAGDAHAELALDQLDIAVKAAEQRNGVFHSVDIDDLFRKAGLPRLLSLC